MSNDKKKKKKATYIDDGRTIADMSALYGSSFKSGVKPHSTFKDHMKTYFDTVKMMFLPMLVTIGTICIIFLVLYLIFELAA